jgi:hypothetical protein
MSSSNDIARWLKETGASARSADDPWTISHRYAPSGESAPGITADLGQSFSGLGAESQAEEQSVRANTQGTQTSGSGSQSGGSSTAAGILGDIFPFAGAIASLFDGGGSGQQAELTPYIFPPSIAFSGALPGNATTTSSLSYGEDGLARSSSSVPSNSPQAPALPDMVAQLQSITSEPFEPMAGSGAAPTAADITSQLSTADSSGGSSSGSDATDAQSSSSGGPGQQVVVQVQAMDSQSFMDRSQDIAQAVRQAMLNSHPVNDVILDL